MMYMGYPSVHKSDNIHKSNAEINRVVVMRDVIWLQRMFFGPSNLV